MRRNRLDVAVDNDADALETSAFEQLGQMGRGDLTGDKPRLSLGPDEGPSKSQDIIEPLVRRPGGRSLRRR